jgi:hypothetical protein
MDHHSAGIPDLVGIVRRPQMIPCAADRHETPRVGRVPDRRHERDMGASRSARAMSAAFDSDPAAASTRGAARPRLRPKALAFQPE